KSIAHIYLGCTPFCRRLTLDLRKLTANGIEKAFIASHHLASECIGGFQENSPFRRGPVVARVF
ncbi:MAG: hypothetical protein ABI977_00200, partial [Acidobacteriota bacterium]